MTNSKVAWFRKRSIISQFNVTLIKKITLVRFNLVPKQKGAEIIPTPIGTA